MQLAFRNHCILKKKKKNSKQNWRKWWTAVDFYFRTFRVRYALYHSAICIILSSASWWNYLLETIFGDEQCLESPLFKELCYLYFFSLKKTSYNFFIIYYFIILSLFFFFFFFFAFSVHLPISHFFLQCSPCKVWLLNFGTYCN